MATMTTTLAERFDELAKRDPSLFVRRTMNGPAERITHGSGDFHHPAQLEFRRLTAEAGETMLAEPGEGERPEHVHRDRFFRWLFEHHPESDFADVRVMESNQGLVTEATIENAAGAAARALRREAGETPPDDEYQPAAWFGPTIAGRLRHASAPGRTVRRVRAVEIEGEKRYSVSDARKWWADDLAKHRAKVESA